MHRTNPVPRSAFGLILLSLAIGHFASAGALTAEEATESVRPAEAAEAAPAKETPAAQEPAPAPRPQGAPAGPPGAGGQPGTAVAGSNIVPVPLGATKTITMRGNLPIRTVINSREDVASVQTMPNDIRTVVITGRQAGTTRVTLVGADENRTTETFEVVVQLDVEFLRSLLLQAVPTASLNLLPLGTAGGVASLVITGNVPHPEDINIIMKVAESVVGTGRAVNAMRVGGVMQVQLDVVVAQVSRTELRSMNFDFLEQGAAHVFSSNMAATTQGAFTGGGAGATAAPLSVSSIFGSANGQNSNIFFALFNNNQQLFSFLQILRTEQLGKLIAEPRLVTMSGRVATFLAGGQQAVPSPGGLGAVSVQFVPFGTQLNFMPIVLGNGRIFLDVAPSVSTLDPASGSTINGFTVAGRLTQQVHTTVEMEEGQTFVIGGLLQNQITGTTIKVPFLGDLPFVGVAFSSKRYAETESELVILVTPHLVDAMDCAQRPKILPGQETRSPDDFELFLEGILEAPRGTRVVSPNRHYLPAYKNGPSANVFPCAPERVPAPGLGIGVHGCAGCGTGLANTPAVGYPGGVSLNGKEADGKPALATDTGRKVDQLPSTKDGEASGTGGAAPSGEGKPATLPTSVGAADGAQK